MSSDNVETVAGLSWRSVLCLLTFGAWVTVSIAAIVAMYYLWWGRERILYIGKPPAVQRAEVFRRAGLPTEILHEIERINKSWPLQIHYSVEGSNTDLSYLIYILSPRIPSPNGICKVQIDKGRLYVDDAALQDDSYKGSGHPPVQPSARALVLSLFLILGSALSIQKLTGSRLISLPELCALSLLGLTLVNIAARVVIGRSSPAMWLMAAFGFSGWISTLPLICRRIRSVIRPTVKNICSKKGYIITTVKWLCIITIAAGFIWSLLMACCVVPDDWDAWATWGPKAKYLALGEGPLINLTRLGLSDYPLLWPSTWSFAAWCAGGWEEHWSKGWGCVLMFLAAWEIGLSVKRQTGNSLPAWLCAAGFVSIPCTPLIASWAYAESGLWLMFTCSLACLLRWRDTGALRELIMAGIFTAAACHTKNEGIIFCFFASLWVIFNDPLRCCRNVASFISPVGVIYGPWFWWTRLKLGLVSATTQNIHFDASHLKWVLSRLPDGILKAASIWLDVRQWNIVLFLVFGMLVYTGVRGNWRMRGDLLLPVGMITCFFMLDLFYDGPIIWTIGTNWNRLTLQVVPLLLILIAPFLYSLGCFKKKGLLVRNRAKNWTDCGLK